MKHNKKAFTLVELIVVAVILTILATVGFISYESYLTDTRDSKRLSQLAGLRDAMRLSITKGALPLPDDGIEIRNNTTTFMYQGYAGKDVLSSIAFSENTKDPFDDSYYTYLLSRNRKDFQLMGFLEQYNPDIISLGTQETYAVDYSQRFPKVFGKKLGILLEQETNTPIQEMSTYKLTGYMDLADVTANLFDAYVTDTYLISGKEDALTGIIPFTTCKKILENGDSYGDGIYNINPSGLNPFEVYCDMTLDSGGWTLVGRSVAGTTTGNFGWLVSSGTVRNNESIYSLGEESKNLNFSEIMLTTYSLNKTVNRAIKIKVNKNFIKDNANYMSDELTSNCVEIYPTTPWLSACDSDGEDGKVGTRNFTRYWGYFYKSDNSGPTDNRFHFRNTSGTNYGDLGLARDGYTQGDANPPESSFGDFHDVHEGMIFVR